MIDRERYVTTPLQLISLQQTPGVTGRGLSRSFSRYAFSKCPLDDKVMNMRGRPK
jgi:hypothetical protein